MVTRGIELEQLFEGGNRPGVVLHFVKGPAPVVIAAYGSRIARIGRDHGVGGLNHLGVAPGFKIQIDQPAKGLDAQHLIGGRFADLAEGPHRAGKGAVGLRLQALAAPRIARFLGKAGKIGEELAVRIANLVIGGFQHGKTLRSHAHRDLLYIEQAAAHLQDFLIADNGLIVRALGVKCLGVAEGSHQVVPVRGARGKLSPEDCDQR